MAIGLADVWSPEAPGLAIRRKQFFNARSERQLNYYVFLKGLSEVPEILAMAL